MKAPRANVPADLRERLRAIFDDPDAWLRAPNVYLGARAPLELIGTESEHLVRDILTWIDHGIPS